VNYKIDLHTHSYGSPDGGLRLKHYKYFLEHKLLDYIAITDHNSIEAAQKIQKELGDLGNQIIVGEEIMTSQGELIGLYLTTKIEPGLSAKETVIQIKQQGGIVYVPHPFETLRSGISEAFLSEIIADVDIIETANGRAYVQNRSRLARQSAEQSNKVMAASSDAHGRYGWGFTFSMIDHEPSKTTLVKTLKTAALSKKRVGIGIIYPKLNRFTRLFTRK